MKQDFELPDWLPLDAWTEFLAMRKKKKNPLDTDRMIKRMITRLDGFRQQGYDITAILDASTNSKWSDTYPIKEAKINTPNPGETLDQFRMRQQASKSPSRAQEPQVDVKVGKMPVGLAEALKSALKSKLVH